MSGYYPPESSATWTPRPVPHPLADVFMAASASLLVLWPAEPWKARDRRPIPAHLKQPGWKYGGGR
jgi:hypothetical protein